MPIISVEIMKPIDERKMQRTTKEKKNRNRKEQGKQKPQQKSES